MSESHFAGTGPEIHRLKATFPEKSALFPSVSLVLRTVSFFWADRNSPVVSFSQINKVLNSNREKKVSRGLETKLVERVVASAIVAVGTRYVVEVERELLQLRVQILEHGSDLGNMELLGEVEDRLAQVSQRMDGLAGEMVKVMGELRRELSRMSPSPGTVPPTGKKRGRPPKGAERNPPPADQKSPI